MTPTSAKTARVMPIEAQRAQGEEGQLHNEREGDVLPDYAQAAAGHGVCEGEFRRLVVM